jgi:surfactin synthase thioesterase subunit
MVLIVAGLITLDSVTYRLNESIDRDAITETTQEYIYVASESPKAVVIYYPGGLVEASAYIPFGIALTAFHVDVYILKMPLNIAFLGLHKGLDVIKESTLPVYLMGHSLGGVAMSMVYDTYQDDVDGLIYLASYPANDLSDVETKVLSIYGTQDNILDMEAYVDAKTLLPSHTAYHVIAGGNHAYFGNYGFQKGDGEACITRLEQQKSTIDAIILWMNLS